MYKALFFLVFIVFSLNSFGQKNTVQIKKDTSAVTQKKFNQKELATYKKDKNFSYTEEVDNAEPTWLDKLLNWFGRQFLRMLEWLFGVEHANGIFAKILAAIPYIIATIMLFLIIKFFLKVNSNNIISITNNTPIVSLTDEEELIKNQDLQKLIQQAVSQKNYRLAVRYNYLYILKKLEEKRLIVWEQQKTNEDYSIEITEINLKNSFKELTRLYDFVWYGNFEINELEFTRVALNFEDAKLLINKA
jgi:hypothetical protein